MPTMQTEESALIRAILTEPQDDTPRLVLADFLEERGAAGDGDRAEFIRVQVELAGVPPCQVEGKVVNWQSPMRACRVVFPEPHEGKGWGPHCAPCRTFVRLRRRERELLERPCFGAHGAANWVVWSKQLVDLLPPSHSGQYRDQPFAFRRGFVHSVTCPTDAWLTHAGMVCGAQPIGDVRLVDKEPEAMGGSCTEYGWYWAPDRRVPRDPGDLPEELWLLLPPPCQPVWDKYVGWKWYRNQHAAREALVLAAVKYGRQRAGLE